MDRIIAGQSDVVGSDLMGSDEIPLAQRAEQALLSLPEGTDAIADAGSGSVWPEQSWAEEPLVLAVADLLPDATGEVVLEEISGGLVVFEGANVAQSGMAEAGRTTADGTEVGGLCYARFDNGTTLYYDPAAQVAFQEG